MTQGRLPIFRVVFVDWHGVLSLDPFWSSVLSGGDKRLRRALSGRLTEVFEGELAAAWMRGEATVEHIVEPIAGALGSVRKDDFLRRRLLEDTLNMRVHEQLVACLQAVAERALLVLATDNTEEFDRAFRRARERGRRASEPAVLRDLAPLFDDILCSSSTGVFKAESPIGFFGQWLDDHGLAFKDALLIDDRRDNCHAFERCGGTSVVWEEHPAGNGLALESIAGFVSSESLPDVLPLFPAGELAALEDSGECSSCQDVRAFHRPASPMRSER